jgi:arsenate reductase
MMTNRVYNVLFLCTGNSARSILAESLLTRWGEGRFRAYSAGSFPKVDVHPMAIDLLRTLELSIAGLRSKSWDEFAAPGTAEMDFIVTVCDQAAGELCPIWPGKPVTAHWGVADPAAATGSEQERRQTFRAAFRVLENRIKLFVSLRVEALDRLGLKSKLAEIGHAQ